MIPDLFRQHRDPSFTGSSGAVLLLAAVLIAILVLIVVASAAPSCMTQNEARAKYPREHLYWHTLARCWNNENPGLGNRKSRWLAKPARDANGNIAHHSGQPLLIDVRWHPRSFEQAQPFNPPIFVMPYDAPDECCWPALDEFERRFVGQIP